MTVRGSGMWSYQCDGPGRSVDDPAAVCRKGVRHSFRLVASAVEHARAHGWDVVLLHGQAFFFCPECRAIAGAGRYKFVVEETDYGVVDGETTRA